MAVGEGVSANGVDVTNSVCVEGTTEGGNAVCSNVSVGVAVGAD